MEVVIIYELIDFVLRSKPFMYSYSFHHLTWRTFQGLDPQARTFNGLGKGWDRARI